MLRTVCAAHDMHAYRNVCTLYEPFCLDVFLVTEYLYPFMSPYLGGGEINTTLSPRTIIKPSFLWLSTLEVSSVSSSTKFRCWSKPLSLPLRLLPPLSRTNTILPMFCSRISVVISLILKPFVTNILSLYLNLSHLNLPSKMGLHTHPHNHFHSGFSLECYSISKAKLREECFKNVFPLRPFAQRRLSS